MLAIDLKGKVAFVAGVGDNNGYGWAVAKMLAEAGATVLVGTWPPVLKIFTTSLAQGKFDESRKLSDGTLLDFKKVYPLDAAYDTVSDVPVEIRENKRYQELEHFTIKDVAAAIAQDFGQIDIFVHALANGPEVKKPLLETSRNGYLAAISASSYSWVSCLQYFGPIIKKGGAALTLSYIASEKVIPGYGGGMSSAKAALESDTRVLAWEAGRKWGVRINAISAGALGSRAAKAIGFIEKMIDYGITNAPLNKDLQSCEVASAAAFLLSPLASAIAGVVLHVDNGLHAMGVAVDSKSLASEESTSI
ncbi:MAG: enoyl-[acyl-carrier-protein] reductase [NADH],chloroplastic [Chlamydiales bacterium]|jgi:enoyl-[acyl-carrier protein] reductase I|nr:enoyl-[acyl-carrier-protein] reductase [NADH],chloroplastic [Chlamydiales bacterium]